MLSEFSPRRTSRLSRVHIVRFTKFGATAPATIEAYRPVVVQLFDGPPAARLLRGWWAGRRWRERRHAVGGDERWYREQLRRLAWIIRDGFRFWYKHKSPRAVQVQCQQQLAPPRRPLRDARHESTDCPVPEPVRQAAGRPLRPAAHQLRRRRRPAQGGREGVRAAGRVRRLSGRPARTGQGAAHIGRPARTADPRHRLRPFRRQ